MKEDIHVKGVGACSCVQFATLSIVTGKTAPRGGVRFAKATVPLRSSANAFVGDRVKISVSGVFGFAEHDGGKLSVSALVGQIIGLGPGKRAEAKFFAKKGSVD